MYYHPLIELYKNFDKLNSKIINFIDLFLFKNSKVKKSINWYDIDINNENKVDFLQF
jgi:hypothetical protein